MADLIDEQLETIGKKMATEPDERTCANCACSFTADHPQFGKQLFCRRNPVDSHEFNVQQPVIRNGQPVMDKRDPTKPMMQSGRALFYLYKPTLPSLTCFDGWRPLETLPGDYSYRGPSFGEIVAGFRRLIDDLDRDRAELAAEREKH